MSYPSRAMLVAVLSLVTWPLSPAATIAAQQKPTLTPDDYGQWQSLGTTRVSPDGRWLAYTIGRVEGDGELRIRLVERDDPRIVALGEEATRVLLGRDYARFD